MNKFVVLTFLLLSALMPIKAINHDSAANMPVCICPEYPPSLEGNMDDIIRYHFKYPVEAWRTQKLTGANVQLLIDTQGYVIGVESEMDLHPALMAEIKRVMLKTKWYPAKDKGHEVIVKCNRHLDFVQNVASPYPLGLDKQVNNAEAIAKSWNKNTFVDDIADDQVNMVIDVVKMFPEHVPTAFGYARYLNAIGNHSDAVQVMDSSFKAYHSLYKSPATFPAWVKDIRFERPGYNGRTEIAVALMRAMTHDLANSPERDKAFEHTLKLINARIVDGDLLENPSPGELMATRAQEDHLRKAMVEELTKGEIQLSRSDELWQRIGGFSIEYISSSLSYWSDKGVLDNAMIQQLTRLLENERENLLTGSRIKDRSINLFGAKALTLWLYKGQDALDSYVASIEAGNDNNKVKRYMSKLCRNLKNNESTLNDRLAVIRSITYLLPDKSEDHYIAELKNCRKTLGNVFPLKWLYN